MAPDASGGKDALRGSLKGMSYEKGAQALGLDPNQLDADPYDMGLDPKRLNEDLASTLKDLYPSFELYLRLTPHAESVTASYSDEAAKGDRSTADGRFTLGLNELIIKTVELCRNAEFTRGADLTSRNSMSKEAKRRQAEKADKMLKELQRLIATMALMAAKVANSPESTRQMQLALMKLMETRNQVSWYQRIFRTEGFEIGGGAPQKKLDDAPPV